MVSAWGGLANDAQLDHCIYLLRGDFSFCLSRSSVRETSSLLANASPHFPLRGVAGRLPSALYGAARWVTGAVTGGLPNFARGWPLSHASQIRRGKWPKPGSPSAAGSHSSCRLGLDLPLQLYRGLLPEGRGAPQPLPSCLRLTPRPAPLPLHPVRCSGSRARRELCHERGPDPGRERPRAPGPGPPPACGRATLPSRRAPTRLAAVAIRSNGGRPGAGPIAGPRRVRTRLAGWRSRGARRPSPRPAGRRRLALSRELADALPGARVGRPHAACPRGAAHGGAGGSDGGRRAQSPRGRRRIGAQPSAGPAARPRARAGPGLSVSPDTGRSAAAAH